MRFTKMQGLGNDYLYVYGEVPENIRELAVRLSDRHFGVGADGMIYMSPSKTADFRMRIFNADGSEAAMCGNGIRCVGKYLYEKGYTDKTTLFIETMSGIRRLELHVTDRRVGSVSVEMGKPFAGEEFLLSVGDEPVRLLPVSVGNPHVVLFVKDADTAPVTLLGPKIEKAPEFPDGVNVEFVSLSGKNSLRMRVWERGSGLTMACGTGACAAAAAALKKGLVSASEPVRVQLDGGILYISIDREGCAVMTGPAEFVFEGETDENSCAAVEPARKSAL